MPDLGGPCMRSRGGMTKMHAPWLQSEPPDPALIVAAVQKLLSRFIISRRERGTSNNRNSIPGLLRKSGWAYCVHVDA